MVLQDKFAQVRSILEEHNAVVSPPNSDSVPKPAGWVDIDSFFATLKAMGATTEDRAKDLSYEEIMECFTGESSNIKPKLVAKAIAGVFRERNVANKEEAAPRPVSAKKAGLMSLRELVEALDPEDPTNAVGERLNKIVKNQPFIVFSVGRMVDVETTYKLLQEIKNQYPGRDIIEVNGDVKQVYRLGELPDNYADENPIYHDRPLRPDGTCDQTGRSWEGISLNIRQLIRVIVDEESDCVSLDLTHKLLDMAMGADAAKKLRTRYRHAALKFDELQKTNQLPNLKIVLGNLQKDAGKSPRPLDDGKKVVWVDPRELDHWKKPSKTSPGYIHHQYDMLYRPQEHTYKAIEAGAWYNCVKGKRNND